MTDQASLELCPDLSCDCFGDLPQLWKPACRKFDDDDQGVCMGCGHAEECHAGNLR
jgi:hypothetical protein